MVTDFAFLCHVFHLVFAAVFHARQAFVCAGHTWLNAGILGDCPSRGAGRGVGRQRKCCGKTESEESNQEADHEGLRWREQNGQF
jgi:hypothetical protein